MPKVESLYIEVCVFKFEASKPKYLILHRSIDEPVYPGIFQFITGKIEKGETSTQAALREMYEEIKLLPKNFWSVPFVNSFYVQKIDIVNFSPLFLAEVQENMLPILSAEHQSFQWLGFHEAYKLLTWQNQRKALEVIHNFLIGKDDWGQHTKIELAN